MFVVLLLLCFFSNFVFSTLGPCETEYGGIVYNNLCLKYFPIITSFHLSRTHCKAWHPAADLVMIKDATKADDLFLGGIVPIGSIRIGLSDLLVEGSFRWVDGETLSWHAFSAGEPNNNAGVEDCVDATYSGAPGVYPWNDYPCDWSFVCEFDMDEIDEVACSTTEWKNVRFGDSHPTPPTYAYCDFNTCPCPDEPFTQCSPPCENGQTCFHDPNNVHPDNNYCGCPEFYDPSTNCKSEFKYDDYQPCPDQQYVELEIYNNDDSQSYKELWPSNKCIDLGLETYASLKYSCNTDGSVTQQIFADFECNGRVLNRQLNSNEYYENHMIFKDEHEYCENQKVIASCGHRITDYDSFNAAFYYLNNYDNEDDNDCTSSRCVEYARIFDGFNADCREAYFNDKPSDSDAYEEESKKHFRTDCDPSNLNLKLYQNYDDCDDQVNIFQEMNFLKDQCEQINHNFDSILPPYGFGVTSERKYGLKWRVKFQCPLN